MGAIWDRAAADCKVVLDTLEVLSLVSGPAEDSPDSGGAGSSDGIIVVDVVWLDEEDSMVVVVETVSRSIADSSSKASICNVPGKKAKYK